MLRRDTPQQRREERQVFGRGGSATRYKMREKLVSFGNDFWIEDENGRRAFKVDGTLRGCACATRSFSRM